MSKHIALRDRPLTPKTQAILDYVFSNPTMNQKQIGDHFGLNKTRISQVLNSDRVLAVYPILAKRRLGSMVPKAVGTFEKLMAQTENLEVSRKVASSVLESAKVLENSPTVVINRYEHLSTEELKKELTGFKDLRSGAIEGELIADAPPLPRAE